MNLIHVDPKALHPNPWNSNEVSAENQTKLTASLQRNGWIRPVLARELPSGDLQILGGQHRTLAAIELGHDFVPVLVLENVNEIRAKEIGLIDNARYGDDDAIGLAEILEELGGAGAMSEFLPISEAELASLGTNISDDEIDDLLDDSAPDPGEKPAKPVKTHQILRFKVALGDADSVTDRIERVMTEQGFTDEDALTNAGDALVWLIGSDQKEDDDV